MHFDDLLRDPQTKACTALRSGRRSIKLMKLLENAAMLLDRDARAGVRHRQLKSIIVYRCPHLYLAHLGEFDGVANKVEKHLGDAPLIPFSSRQIFRYGRA